LLVAAGGQGWGIASRALTLTATILQVRAFST
jgi:hypothetical protein